MAVPITVAKIGWGTEPVTLVEWKASEGDRVEKNSTILVTTTEKIESDIDAEASGYLHIITPEGVDAEIGSVVGLIAETKEELEVVQKETPPEFLTPVAVPEEAPSPQQMPARPTAAAAEVERIKISPVARKMAEEHMIDITTVKGTGPGGRIVREDIERAIETKGATAVPGEAAGGKRVRETIPLKGMRAAIANNMYRSLSTSAQLTLMGEIDMAEAVKLRETLKAQAEDIGVSITYTDIFICVVARALSEHPIINSSLENNVITLWEDINIGVAVALDDGLIVPVIKNADKKSIVEISRTAKTLAEKAREGKLVPEDVTGGTFTITNLGALGGGYRFETVIINGHESAILGTGGISDRVVARDGKIVIRPIMTYYFTYDHRIINGAVAAEFMAAVIGMFENPSLPELEKNVQ